jgi:hypothetical protein
MVFVSKKDATNKNGTVKKGFKEIKMSNGSSRYVAPKEVKEKIIKPKVVKKESKPVKEVKTPKINIKGVKKSLTEGID